MALRELVTILRYELQDGSLKKYVDGYRKAEKTINQVAQAASTKFNGALRDTVRTTAQVERGTNRVSSAMGRLVYHTREFSIGLRQGARQGYGEVIRQMDRVEARQRRLRRAGGGVGRAGEGVGFLGGAIQGIIASISGKVAMDASDEWAGIGARIGLQTSDAAARSRSTEFLFRTAQRTGQGISPLSDTFVSLARGRGEIGLSNDQTLQLSSIVSKLMTIGGGSRASQEAALTQFGQAMNSGVLRGDELNSILDQAPRLAQAIAEALGTSVGKLKSLGEEGKITAKVIAEGLLKQTQKVDAEFARMPMTFGRSMTQLRNQFVRRVGELNEQYDLAGRFNRVALVAINNMDKIGAALALIAGSAVGIRVFRVLAVVFGGLQRSGRVLLLFFDRLAQGKWAQAFAKLGPIGLRVLGIFRWLGAAISGIGVVGLGVFAAIAAAVIAAGLAIYKYWEPIKAWFVGFFQGLWDAAQPALAAIGDALGTLKPAWEGFTSALGEIWDSFLQLISPVKLTREQLDDATASGRAFGVVLGLVLANGLRGFAALIRAIGWVISKLGAVNALVAKIPVVGTYAQMAALAVAGPTSGANWTNVGPGQITSAGRPGASNQTITNHASVSVMAPSSNPAAVGAAAQRGTSKAMSSFDYAFPTPVEAF